MALHPFEITLGPGPYDFVGLDDAGGACHHCGRAIRYRCLVRNRDGTQLTVGSDCIAKINEPYIAATEIQIAVATAQKAVKQAKAESRNAALIPKLAALISKHGERLLCFRGLGCHRHRTLLSYAKMFLDDPQGIAPVIKRIQDLEKNNLL